MKASPLEDEQGIDFFVCTSVGTIPFQVKSSEAGKRKALRKHPRIPVVVIGCADTSEEVMLKVIDVVQPLYEKYAIYRQQSWD